MVYQVFVASPSDVTDEREVATEVIARWDSMHALAFNTVLLPVLWETHATPEMGIRPQEAINKQLLHNCDILVGMFWTRLGTPTGKAESGTVEEIREFIEDGKPVLLYFSSRPGPPADLNSAEYLRVQEFQKWCQENGLYDGYRSLDEFREKLDRHLNSKLRQLVGVGGYAPPQQGSATETSSAGLKPFRDAYQIFLRRFEVEWTAERDSQPYGVEDARIIVQRAASTLTTLQANFDLSSFSEVQAKVTNLVTRLVVLQKHRVYMDGGISFRNFWTEGDQLLAEMKQFLASLDGMIQKLQS
jgi:hypothetical protein